MPGKYLALDFGAESGRAILGKLSRDKIDLTEIHRFENRQVERNGHTHWDIQHLFTELKRALQIAANSGHKDLDGIAVDTWGVDFGLLDDRDQLIDDPVVYRDARTNGMVERALELMPAEELYRNTGNQMIQINTLFQLLSLVESKKHILEKARTLLFMPDLFNLVLTGNKRCEYTIASTSQLLNARTKQWADAVFDKLNLPRSIMLDVLSPGARVGKLLPAICAETGLTSVEVIAAGGHDTACAVGAVPAKGEDWAYISSGTWSLVGVELDEPILDERGRKNNFTNEGGINNRIRFLRNTMGLWLLQRCQQNWAEAGETFGYDELVEMAGHARPFHCWIDPDDTTFLNPSNMPAAIANFCKRTNQSPPADKSQFIRTVLESLALKYRYVIDLINEIRGKKLEVIHIVGGGSKNELLNQFTANATGLPVIAGPVEATAAGNVLSQAAARGEIPDFGVGRELVARSFPLKTYEPSNHKKWADFYQRTKPHFT
jgi:sugar (pentulose or hexulose) kinase